jgi:ATP synthase protein I
LSATSARSASQSDAFAQLLRGSLLPTAGAGLVCVLVGLFSSPKAAWSAALGAAIVVFFFSLTLLVMKRTADLPPTTTMIVVMVTYTFKVLVLAVAMFALRDVSWASGFAIGLSVTVCAVVWLFFEMRSYKRLRIFAYDPDGEASLDASTDASTDVPTHAPTHREPRDEP